MSDKHEQFTGAWYLDNIFYCVYDIDSVGLRPQMQLVETLIKGGLIEHERTPLLHSPSYLIATDNESNLFSNVPLIAKLFDPTVYTELYLKDYAPENFFAKEQEKLRSMRQELDRLKRTGRSFNLRTMAGYPAVLGQPEITEKEAKYISKKLPVDEDFAGVDSETCLSFVRKNYSVIKGMERQTYKHWNTDGRHERTLYHAAKLDLMNAITDAAIKKARTLQLDPSVFTRNDPYHADQWKQIYNEDVPTPDVLLARSQAVTDLARKKYQR